MLLVDIFILLQNLALFQRYFLKFENSKSGESVAGDSLPSQTIVRHVSSVTNKNVTHAHTLKLGHAKWVVVWDVGRRLV